MRATWWGHATATLELDGVRLLTDPVLTGSLGHLRRRRGERPGSLARECDVVLISHLHGDHLHLRSLQMLDPAVPLVVPLGTVAYLRATRGRKYADRCIEMDVGDEIELQGLRITAVHAEHTGYRHNASRFRAAALGYIVRGTQSIWFAGDTDVCDQMRDFGHVDLALIPIGGWGPSLPDGHMGPEEAVEALQMIGVRRAVPIHYGTLWPRGMSGVREELFLGPERRFASLAAESVPDCRIDLLDPGQTTEVRPG